MQELVSLLSFPNHVFKKFGFTIHFYTAIIRLTVFK